MASFHHLSFSAAPRSNRKDYKPKKYKKPSYLLKVWRGFLCIDYSINLRSKNSSKRFLLSVLLLLVKSVLLYHSTILDFCTSDSSCSSKYTNRPNIYVTKSILLGEVKPLSLMKIMVLSNAVRVKFIHCINSSILKVHSCFSLVSEGNGLNPDYVFFPILNNFISWIKCSYWKRDSSFKVCISVFHA